jgi:fumarate reductase iron-sulfur subunit
MEERITLEVTRYYPGRDKEPRLQTYEVPLRKDWVVLDALNYVKDKVDGSLSLRWSCRMGICGRSYRTTRRAPFTWSR